VLDDASRKLEFEKVRQRVVRYAVSEPGRRILEETAFSSSAANIAEELSRVTEMKNLVIEQGEIPLSGIHPVGESVQRSSLQGTILTPVQLLQIASTLRAARVLRSFFRKIGPSFPLLKEMTADLEGNRVLEFNINGALDESAAVRSSASKELQSIRRAIADRYAGLRKSLERILRDVSGHGFTQDDLITTREGRMVIPVKVEHKNRVPGFVHSSSGSGATVFVEPTETLELNNEITQLQFDEQREVHRILAELSRQVGENRDRFQADLNTLARLDALHAKARYSLEVLGTEPRVAEAGPLCLKGARHPLLISSHGIDRTVPLDLTLGGEDVTLVISGPNAGGKSVAMKTVGLLCMMTMAGLHIPASESSVVRVFRKIFADIGDEQSIENDLSTFSSHLSRLREIMAEADGESLALIDEIGSGTDPSEGGAIAAAVLQELTEKRVITIATTHHGMLKVWAHATAGVLNGAMEFDAATLSPTYRFRSGIPGSSYALEMAERLGIDRSVIERSRSFLGEEKARLEELIAGLEASAQQHRMELEMLAEERKRFSGIRGEYERKQAALDAEIREVRKRAKEEAADLLQKSKSIIEQTVREIRESHGDREAIRAARGRFLAAKEELEQLEKTSEPGVGTSASPIGPGSVVRLSGSSLDGVVESIETDGKSAFAVFGNVRMRVELTDLTLSSDEEAGGPPVTRAPGLPFEREHGVERELDLRGLTGEEALPLVDKFIDTAVLSGLHHVDIIHGKGTGALRKKVSEFLAQHPSVRSFRLGEWNEGGTGATIVELTD
jgi:DNA mismatch repair protein MutS2